MNIYLTFFLITQAFFSFAQAFTLDDAITKIENEQKTKNGVDERKIVCTKSFHSNFRKGPDINFPIEYEILKSGYPLRVIKYADTWYAVEDFEGRMAWVGAVNVKAKCGAIVKSGGFASVFFMPNVKSKILFSLERGYILNNINCQTDLWCEVLINKTRGWIQKKDVWGV